MFNCFAAIAVTNIVIYFTYSAIKLAVNNFLTTIKQNRYLG